MVFFTPVLGSALEFAFKQATTEGKITICALIIVSVFSWTVIISKSRQLVRARKAAKKFFTAYRATRDPLEIYRRKDEFDGAPAYELYLTGAEETEYHLKNNPINVEPVVHSVVPGVSNQAQTDVIARSITTKISHGSFETVRVALERAASTEALSLE